jgi:dihydropteroate synthase
MLLSFDCRPIGRDVKDRTVGMVAGVLLYGVVNASPDSLNTDSIATTAETAVARARQLLADGADAIDLGGQGSTDAATVVDWRAEWARLEAIVPALAGLGVDVSIDSWRPEVVRRALEAGATVINAADGMQHDAMWEVAADFDVPIVVPFLSGPNPRQLEHVRRDPVEEIVEFFTAQLAVAARYGRRDRCIIDPGTGFAPPEWPWDERYAYQKRVYTNLDALRRFGLPLYIALPWKETAQHDELLDIVVRQAPEYGRAHYPAKVRAFERRAAVHG